VIVDQSEAKIARAWLKTQAVIAESVPGGVLERGPSGALMSLTTTLIPALNGVLDISDEPDPSEIAALAASTAVQATTPWSIQLRVAPSEEIRRIAAKHGLVRESTYSLMILHLDEKTAAAPSSSGGVRIRAVGAAESELYADALAAGFEVNQVVFGNLNSPRVLQAAGVTAYLAEHEDNPVATGLASIVDDCVGLFNIATPPRYRRRGYARAMTQSMLHDAYAAGERIAFLSPSPMGLPLYESLGFRAALNFTSFAAP
jgi:GNAT superfamily N-acetyltransferase